MRPDDVQIETPAQWVEHSEAWRFAHLDQAPSEQFRRMAIAEHERMLHGKQTGELGPSASWFHLRRRRRG
jgi:hypothetical protein